NHACTPVSKETAHC
ncbi:unnamed protein product, partial [Leptidea sinapis]